MVVLGFRFLSCTHVVSPEEKTNIKQPCFASVNYWGIFTVLAFPITLVLAAREVVHTKGRALSERFGPIRYELWYEVKDSEKSFWLKTRGGSCQNRSSINIRAGRVSRLG